MTKNLQLYRSLGTKLTLGWERDDLPGIVHAIVQAEQGEKFNPATHYPCAVCADHDYTLTDFHQEVKAVLERGPQ